MRPLALRLFGCLLVFGLVLLGSSRAPAQGAPQMHFDADVDTVGVGDVLHLDLSVQSSEGMPTDPQPGATPGFTVRGQSSSPSQTHISINGARTDRYGLTVSWALLAQRVGTFTIGPATIVVGGSRYSTHPLTIRVVPAGQGPQRQAQAPPPQPAPFGFSPFDPWKALLQGQNQGQGEPDLGPPPVVTDPKWSLDAPRAPYYFLHAVVDKPNAVVGEQVRFSVYEYLSREDERLVEIDGSDAHEPTAADFVKHPLIPEDREVPLVGFANIGGHTWRVTLIRQWALFPLRTGDLSVSPMSVTLVRPRTSTTARTSETLRVHVTEPPVVGRPPGYQLGDVGRFALTAQATPRDVDQGGAVGVHVELSGTGNLPASIAPPAREGVEWLSPELHDQLGPIGRETFGGKRTFDYVVRVRRAGDVDLGEVSVPFWDPEHRSYDVARAKLGVVHVKPSAAAPVASGAVEPEALAGLPAARDVLEGTAVARAHADDSRTFWLLGVGAWPLAFGLAVAGRVTGRRFLHAWRARKASPATELRERVSAAGAACHRDDARAADAAIMRALEAATVAHAGVSVRGAVGGEVVDRLEGAGVAKDAATGVADLLRECEAARFSPVDTGVAAARERWARARGVLRQLEKRA